MRPRLPGAGPDRPRQLAAAEPVLVEAAAGVLDEDAGAVLAFPASEDEDALTVLPLLSRESVR